MPDESLSPENVAPVTTTPLPKIFCAISTAVAPVSIGSSDAATILPLPNLGDKTRQQPTGYPVLL
jgi:hypothetical protein